MLSPLCPWQIVAQNQGQTNKETRHQFSRMLLGMADMPAVLVHLADRLQVRALHSTPDSDYRPAELHRHRVPDVWQLACSVCSLMLQALYQVQCRLHCLACLPACKPHDQD